MCLSPLISNASAAERHQQNVSCDSAQKCTKTPRKGVKMINTLFTPYPSNMIKTITDSSLFPLQSSNHELGLESDLSLGLNCS